MKGLDPWFHTGFHECLACFMWLHFNMYGSWQSYLSFKHNAPLFNCSSVLHLHSCRYVYVFVPSSIEISQKFSYLHSYQLNIIMCHPFKLMVVLWFCQQNSFGLNSFPLFSLFSLQVTFQRDRGLIRNGRWEFWNERYQWMQVERCFVHCFVCDCW